MKRGVGISVQGRDPAPQSLGMTLQWPGGSGWPDCAVALAPVLFCCPIGVRRQETQALVALHSQSAMLETRRTVQPPNENKTRENAQLPQAKDIIEEACGRA